MIGHSLGGMLARFLGINFPEKISHVFALGSPIDGNIVKVHPLVPFAFRTLQALRKRTDGASPVCGSPSCRCICVSVKADQKEKRRFGSGKADDPRFRNSCDDP